ncbi:hypothetical protein B0H13DRAFT_1875060 [Mycena leptocephala]|nr:hypothetical protein B0H13DRAFT_1875060 [Mycena leptocephala]
MDTDMNDPDDNAGDDDEDLDLMDDADDSEKDPSFEGRGRGGEEPDDDDDDDNDDIQAKIAAYEKSLRAKKKGKGSEKNASKLQKVRSRFDIFVANQKLCRDSSAPRYSRHKVGNPSLPSASPQKSRGPPRKPTKKPKATEGDLKANWQKDLGLEKLPRKSKTSWSRSASESRASSTSATSGVSQPSAVSSSVGEVPVGEFDKGEAASSVQAACAVKAQGKATAKVSATSAYGNHADVSRWGSTVTVVTCHVTLSGASCNSRTDGLNSSDGRVDAVLAWMLCNGSGGMRTWKYAILERQSCSELQVQSRENASLEISLQTDSLAINLQFSPHGRSTQPPMSW